MMAIVLKEFFIALYPIPALKGLVALQLSWAAGGKAGR